MKAITIAGRIGKDAAVRDAGDKRVCGFSVAVDGYENRQKVTYWFDVSLWGARGEKLAQHLTKGSSVCVSGELTRREHDGKTYLGVSASDVTLLGGRPREDGNTEHSGGGGGGMDDDPIPFSPEWR